MDNVAANLNSEVTTDGSWLSGQRVGGTDDLTGGGNNTVALPDLRIYAWLSLDQWKLRQKVQ